MQFKSPLPGQVDPKQPNPQRQPSTPPQYSFPSQEQPGGYQQPALPASQPPRGTMKKRWLILIAVGAIILVQLLVYLGFQGLGSLPLVRSSSTNTTRTVLIPATQPTRLIAKAGPAILGADIGTFVAKYGQPLSNSRPGNGIYVFALHGNAQTHTLSVTTTGNRAFYILLQAPAGQEWDETQAANTCMAFTPADKVYERSLPLDDTQGGALGVQQVYVSKSLLPLFPASSFTDGNGKQTTAGTFTIVLNYAANTTTHFSSCAVEVGFQKTASGA